ncbi:MAG: hypothetical protein U1E60_13845 [Reyranellaceae bacterium]
MTLADTLGFLRFCAFLAAASLGGALIYAAFLGRLHLGGLLIDKQTRVFSVARLQLVGVAIVISVLYLQKVGRWQGAEMLPEFDETWIAALSAGGYGIAKLDSTLRASTALTLLQTIFGNPRRIP